MTQLTLFHPALRSPIVRCRIARRVDPASSQLAADAVTFSGRREAQAMRCLELVRLHPGCTSRELAELGGEDRYVVARRLPELERSGLVRKGEQKICTVGCRLAVTWEIV